MNRRGSVLKFARVYNFFLNFEIGWHEYSFPVLISTEYFYIGSNHF
jgi:hypothetical protein